MNAIDRIKQAARRSRKTIVMPETHDPRIVHAASHFVADGLGGIILLGKTEDIHRTAAKIGAGLYDVEIIDPATDLQAEAYIEHYVQRRKHRGMTAERAATALSDPIFYGAFMVAAGRADGMVAGSASPTAKVIRAALHAIGPAAGFKTISGCFVEVSPNRDLGSDGAFIFADCGVVPEPTSEQLVEITISAAASCRQLLGREPRVALLSFSTKGSASSPAVEKVVAAVKILEQRGVDFIFDGELQLDAAIISDVAEKKAPDSRVAGRANVLIFPDLGAGNIGYKLAERFGNCVAVGPILQGLAKPVNDLSRGCNVQEIVLAAAVTAVQAGED